MPWGTNEWITTTTQNNCQLYVVLNEPRDPRDLPWRGVLDIACSVAWGCDTETGAMDEIWNNFYSDAGRTYDTYVGAPRYAYRPPDDKFDLTQWLSKYPNVEVVNCHDMAQAEVVFANGLGCNISSSRVNNFGYPNCIYPIGCSWWNDPFYDSRHHDDSPIVDGDAADDGIPWNHAGRSGFAKHAVARYGASIYDASAGKVDVDADPDYGPPHTEYSLDGGDHWSGYKDKVIDDNPPSSPTSPLDYGFDVE